MYLAEIGKLIMFHYKTGLLPDIFQNNLETTEIEINLRLKNFCNLNSILTCNIYMFVFAICNAIMQWYQLMAGSLLLIR